MAEGGRGGLNGRNNGRDMAAVQSFLGLRMQGKGIAAKGTSLKSAKLAGGDIFDDGFQMLFLGSGAVSWSSMSDRSPLTSPLLARGRTLSGDRG